MDISDTKLTVDEAKFCAEFISSKSWRFAKTMPTIPHWYIVRANPTNEDDDNFVDFAQLIRDKGVHMKWGKYNFPYLILDGYKYWSMGYPLRKYPLGSELDKEVDTAIINRARLDGEKDPL